MGRAIELLLMLPAALAVAGMAFVALMRPRPDR